MSTLVVLARVNYPPLLTGKYNHGLLELSRENHPIQSLTIYEAVAGNLLFPSAAEGMLSITLAGNTYVLPATDFINLWVVAEIQQCQPVELEIIKNYHLAQENYELLLQIDEPNK